MKGLKTGIAALMIAALAVTAVAVAAQTPDATDNPSPTTQTEATAESTTQAPKQKPGWGQRGMGGQWQVIADALGVDVAALQSDLKNGKSIADIAKEKNIELSTVVDAAVAQWQTALNTAVTNGRLTQAQADAQIELLKANLNVLFTQSFTQGAVGFPGFGLASGGMGDVLAKVLGVDVAALRTDLQNGKTIADIAAEKNVELSTVVDTVLAERVAALNAAVTTGRLTQDQVDAQIALLKADLTAAFSEKMGRGFGLMGMGGFGGPMGGFNGGFGGFGGPMGGFNGGFGGFGGPDHRPGNRPGGNGSGWPMGPGGNGGHGHRPGNNGGWNGNNKPGSNAPAAPDATPEATANA